MLDSPYSSDDDDINTYVSKPSHLEPTIKHLMKETRMFHREPRNLVRRGHNIRVKISLMKKIILKAMRGRSRYNFLH